MRSEPLKKIKSKSRSFKRRSMKNKTVDLKPSKLSKTLYLIFPEFNKIEQGLSEEEVNKKILEI